MNKNKACVQTLLNWDLTADILESGIDCNDCIVITLYPSLLKNGLKLPSMFEVHHMKYKFNKIKKKNVKRCKDGNAKKHSNKV